jgi:hypothetical protein
VGRDTRRRVFSGIMLLLVAGIIVGGGCSPADGGGEPVGQPVTDSEPAGRLWMDIELRDVASGETFTIGDYAGRPVLLESFAVWCPTCTVQQREIGRLREREGEAIVHISLDTDPNESEAIVEEHLTRNGFDWYYAISPIELTRALMDDFGLAVVNAPGAPIVLVCADQSTRLLRSGVKTADDLLAEIEDGCGQ